MAQVLPAERDLRRVIGDADGVGDREVDGLGEQELLEVYRSLPTFRPSRIQRPPRCARKARCVSDGFFASGRLAIASRSAATVSGHNGHRRIASVFGLA